MSAGLLQVCARKEAFATKARAKQIARKIGDKRLAGCRCWPHAHYHLGHHKTR